MAIQMRRGSITNLDRTKLLPGEWAICTDGTIVICYASGKTVDVVTKNNIDRHVLKIENSGNDVYTVYYSDNSTEKLTIKSVVEVDKTLTVSGKAADAKTTGDKISELKTYITDKATLENGVIKFWKTSTEESGTDTLLYSVDISSIGGTGGLDLENLTLSVSQVGEYQRLSMSDGATTKTVDIPITAITDEQVSTAVQKYLTENPISGLDASTAEQNQVPVADGNGNWSWQTQQSGTGSEETDPTVPNWAKQPNKPTYTADEVKADPSGTAVSKINEHNTSSIAHDDIRELITELTSRLNALANSDDTTLDQLSEIVAYIKSNKSLIDSITTSKVSVSDIVDNLTSSDAKKPLSAKQGVALKALVDAITIPEKLPNPNSLSITVNGTTEIYDGSEPKTISITSGTGSSDVEIDESLTISGKAADSKVVGDMLSQLSEKNASDIAELKNNSVTMYEDSNGDIVMEVGGVSI